MPCSVVIYCGDFYFYDFKFITMRGKMPKALVLTNTILICNMIYIVKLVATYKSFSYVLVIIERYILQSIFQIVIRGVRLAHKNIKLLFLSFASGHYSPF